MKSILTLVLLSVFMAQPSFAMRYFIKRVSVEAPPVVPSVDFPGVAYYYAYEVFKDDTSVFQLQTTTPTILVTKAIVPFGTAFKLRVWPYDINNNRGLIPSNYTEDGKLCPDFDYDNNGFVDGWDFANLKRLSSTVLNIKMFMEVFGSRVVTSPITGHQEYVKW